MKEYRAYYVLGSLILVSLNILVFYTCCSPLLVVNAQRNNEVDEIRVQGGVWSLAIDSNTDRVYVIAADSDSVFEIDGTNNRVINQFLLGGRPMDTIAVNPNTHLVYTILQNGSIVTLDTSSNNISMLSNPNIRNPVQISVNPSTNSIYVTSSYDNATYVIDGNTSALERTIIDIKSPWRIGINSNTNMIYVISLISHIGYLCS